MPAVKDPKTPQMIVTPPSPEIYELVNPSGSKTKLKVDPKPMNVPSKRAKATINKTKSLFVMTFFSTVHMFTCVCFLRLTKLGASLGPVLMASINPPAIIDTKMHCCRIMLYILCLISSTGLFVVMPLKIKPVCKNASRFPAGTESALSVMTMSLWESGNHLFGIKVVAQTKIG